ncbi:phosphatase [Consotaella aegiceratis]|uniref:phosphatase domain-containing putative toxin n=1 Tax=Consotaella aegiceratis TaxID=3097961 RepID=UPI002F426C2B
MPPTTPADASCLVVPNGGVLLLDRCPGRGRTVSETIDAYRRRGVSCLLSLVEDQEFPDRDALLPALSRNGIDWLRFPVVNFSVPGDEQAWLPVSRDLHRRLDRGAVIAIHCWGGLGRTGMIAARLLVERGSAVEVAIAAVRRARPGAVETAGQEAWIAHAPASSAVPE